MADGERITPGSQVWRRRPADERKRREQERQERDERKQGNRSNDDAGGADSEHVDVYV